MLFGGNDLQKYGGDAPERVKAEHFVRTFIENNIPVLEFVEVCN